MTTRVFESLVDLEALDRESERAVLTDWLVKEGKAQNDITSWVAAPYHIRYETGCEAIKKRRRRIDSCGAGFCFDGRQEAPHTVLHGTYENISDDCSDGLAKMFKDIPLSRGFEEKDIAEAIGKGSSVPEGQGIYDSHSVTIWSWRGCRGRAER